MVIVFVLGTNDCEFKSHRPEFKSVFGYYMQRRRLKNLDERVLSLKLLRRIKNNKFVKLYITFSKHNVHIVATDSQGCILMRDSSGTIGFNKSARNNSAAFIEVGQLIIWQLYRAGARNVQLFIRGKHRFRRTLLYGLKTRRLVRIQRIHDISPVNHNGCRLCSKPRKVRTRRFQRMRTRIMSYVKKLTRKQKRRRNNAKR